VKKKKKNDEEEKGGGGGSCITIRTAIKYNRHEQLLLRNKFLPPSS
jgi:hypothetical protein